MRFPRQEYWSGLPFPSPGDLPNPGIKPGSPALAGGLFTIEPRGKARCPSKHPSLPLHLRYLVKCLQNVGPLKQVASGGPVVKTSPSNARAASLIPGQGAEITYASGPKNQSIKQKQYCKKFNKDFKKNGPH